MTALGITPNNHSKTELFGVFKENWQALEVFIASSNQWRYAPMGGLVGLDAQGVLAVMQMHGVDKKNQAHLFEQIRRIESGVLRVVNQKET